MIGYYLSSGDEDGADMFTPYIWKEHGFDTLFNSKQSGGYGDDMDLLLIQYYLEGKFSTYVPSQPKMGNYMKKSKDISVAIGVPRELFHDRNEFERREFILDTTLQAIGMVRDRLLKRKLDINFKKLIHDIKTMENEYLSYPEPYCKSI